MADGRPYLLGLRLAGRRVLVAGGGAVAGRRVPALLDAGAAVFLVSPEVTGSLEDLAQSGRIQWARRPFQPGDTGGAWLVCACTNDPAANEAIVAEAEQHRIWSIRADDAQRSPVWTPASGLAGDVQVGVLSGDPRHSAGLRDAIVTGLRSGTVGARRGRQHRSGVALVGGGPGDPGLITVRGRQLLAEADVVVTDRLAPRSVLDELPPDVEIVDVAKIPYGRSVAQEHINAALITRAQAGKFVVRLKGGDPYVFGRGAEEVIACLQAGVPVTVVPGITSAVAVPAAANVPVTHRGVAQEFSVVSVHVPPGDPRSTVVHPYLIPVRRAPGHGCPVRSGAASRARTSAHATAARPIGRQRTNAVSGKGTAARPDASSRHRGGRYQQVIRGLLSASAGCRLTSTGYPPDGAVPHLA